MSRDSDGKSFGMRRNSKKKLTNRTTLITHRKERLRKMLKHSRTMDSSHPEPLLKANI